MTKPYNGELYEAMGGVAFKRDDPRKAEKIEKILKDDSYIGQRKLNGERLMTYGGEFAYGRGSSKYGGRMEKTGLVPHILSELGRFGTSKNLVLDGEVLYVPNGEVMSIEDLKEMNFVEDFWKCREIMGKQYVDRAIDQQRQEGWLHFFIFDVLVFEGLSRIDDALEKRLEELDYISNYFKNSRYVHIVPYVRGEAAKRNLLDSCLNAGLEGIMGKKLSGIYVPGKKPANQWWKLKKAELEDGIVLGYSDPSPETEITVGGKKMVGTDGHVVTQVNRFFQFNWIGAIWVGQWTIKQPTKTQLLNARSFGYTIQEKEIDGVLHRLIPVAKISGMKDEMRAEISSCKNSYLGKVVALDYFDKTEDAYYQPRFSHFRDDKPSDECIWE